MDAIGKMIGLVVLITFAIDCVVSGARSLLVSERIQRLRKRPWRPAGDKLRAQVRQNALLGMLSAALCAAAVNFTTLRIAEVLSSGSVDPKADLVLTWIILVAGADRFRELMSRMKGQNFSAERKETPAVRIALDRDGEVRALKAV